MSLIIHLCYTIYDSCILQIGKLDEYSTTMTSNKLNTYQGSFKPR